MLPHKKIRAAIYSEVDNLFSEALSLVISNERSTNRQGFTRNKERFKTYRKASSELKDFLVAKGF